SCPTPKVDDAARGEHPPRMMRRRREDRETGGLGPIGAAARSALAAAFGLAVAMSPVSMISCPHHGGASTIAAADLSDHPGPHISFVSHHGQADESGPAGDHDHDGGHCCCLGQCCPGGSTAHPMPAAHDVPRPSAAAALAPAAGDAPLASARAWLLPWPNGPPAVS
ncbi:MAG: hypothetical protein ACODAA_08320, partial [Gemmatimonadota bacterium]